jgi:hypothetical protein
MKINRSNEKPAQTTSATHSQGGLREWPGNSQTNAVEPKQRVKLNSDGSMTKVPASATVTRSTVAQPGKLPRQVTTPQAQHPMWKCVFCPCKMNVSNKVSHLQAYHAREMAERLAQNV